MAKFNNIDLPNGIAKYVYKKIARCVLMFMLLESVSVGISVLSWQVLAAKTSSFLHIGILVLLGIVPFFASGFPFKLIDRSWTGIVEDICIKEKTGTYLR